MKAIKKYAIVCLVLAICAFFFNAKAMAEDPGVRIVSPKQGQQFAPGDKVRIKVEIPASLHATDGGVGAAGLGSLKAEEYKFSGTNVIGFKANLDIPDSFAGSIELEPWAYPGDIAGPKCSIQIRPHTPPKSLSFANRNYSLSPSDGKTQLYVSGEYENGTKLDLTSSVTGTTYLSSDPAVISVDHEGLCRITGKGLSVVTVQNGGVHDFVMFEVEDAQHPNAPIDMTGKVSIQRGSQREEERGLRIRQTVTITNKTNLPIEGPLWLVVADLPDGARVYGDKVGVSLPDGLNLFPGQSATAELTFLLWKDVKVSYNIKLYHGA